MTDSNPLRVMVWDENPAHAPKEVYPHSINGCIASNLNEMSKGSVFAFRSNLDDPEQGCSEAALSETDVLIWWGHARHREVSDETMMRVYHHVHHRGMGFLPLHSAHYAKTFQAVLSCPGHLKGGWREGNPPDTEEITVAAPKHPIAQGVEPFVLDREEMYGAPFDVPPPQCVVFQSYFPVGSEYFPSGMCWSVGDGKKPGFTSGGGNGEHEGEGLGRVFYFRPGHETFPTYSHPMVQKILLNAVLWCGRR